MLPLTLCVGAKELLTWACACGFPNRLCVDGEGWRLCTADWGAEATGVPKTDVCPDRAPNGVPVEEDLLPNVDAPKGLLAGAPKVFEADAPNGF